MLWGIKSYQDISRGIKGYQEVSWGFKRYPVYQGMSSVSRTQTNCINGINNIIRLVRDMLKVHISDML